MDILLELVLSVFGVVMVFCTVVVLLAQRRRIRELERQVDDLTPVHCRVCACTDDDACWGGCWWVEPDLCSSCADDAATLGSSLEGGR